MTTKAETTKTEKEEKAETVKARKAELEAREVEANKGRTGKGTRISFSLSRGRNPQPIQFEAFDDSQPDTLPVTLAEAMELTNTVDDEPQLVKYIIEGFNSLQYEAASDPVAEFVEASWPEDIQKTFKSIVKGYAASTGISIDDAVAMMKPGIVASEEKKAAAKKAAAETTPA